MTDVRLKVIFIAGSGRSGSTLLERMLGHVEGFFPAGELENVWHRGFQESQLCSCGKRFLECAFWTTVAENAFGGTDPHAQLVDLHTHRNRIRSIPQLRFPRLRTRQFAHDLAEYQRALRLLYGAIAKTAGTTAIVDSSKGPAYAFLLATIAEIDLSVIHLVRDSRAVSYSWKKTVLRPEVIDKEAYMGGFRPATTAGRWNVKNVLSELLRASAQNYVRIRYEDLVEEPQDTLAAVLTSVAPETADPPGFGEGPDSVSLPPRYHTVSGNPIRLVHDELPIRPDRDWITNLDARSKRIVTALTLPLLVRYGYSLSSDVASRHA
jgi:hypothetical protein